jgi:mRNA interferase MazF
MTRYKRGDVLVTAFPLSDSARLKKRPVVCVAALKPTRGIILYWVLMVTSTKLPRWSGDVRISDIKKAGLPIPSIVRTSKIACVDSSFIEKKVGALDVDAKTAVSRALSKMVG